MDQPAEKRGETSASKETELNPFASPTDSSQAIDYRRRRTLNLSLILWGALSVPAVLWTLQFILLFAWWLVQSIRFGFGLDNLLQLLCIAVLGLPGVIPPWMFFRKYFPSRHDKLLARYRK